MTYGYIRVSTDRQDTENQKIGINEKARALNTRIDEWIADDGVSGTKEPDKRMLGVLLNKIQPGDILIASEISRLGRKLFMIMRILEHLMKVEAKLYTVKDGYELGDNIQSKVLAFAFGLAAEIERDMISKRTLEGLAKRRKDGVILGRRVGSGSGTVALKGREDQVKLYLDAGLGINQIARVLEVNRITVYNLAIQRGWYVPSETACRFNVPSQLRKIFNDDQIQELKTLVTSEPSAKKMCSHFKDKHDITISQAMLIKYVKDLGLYPEWVATNDRMRATYNTECGKNRFDRR